MRTVDRVSTKFIKPFWLAVLATRDVKTMREGSGVHRAFTTDPHGITTLFEGAEDNKEIVLPWLQIMAARVSTHRTLKGSVVSAILGAKSNTSIQIIPRV